MYESIVDVLYNLYDKLSIGRYVIMDDWFGFPSRTACKDFLQFMESILKLSQLTTLLLIGRKQRMLIFSIGDTNSQSSKQSDTIYYD